MYTLTFSESLYYNNLDHNHGQNQWSLSRCLFRPDLYLKLTHQNGENKRNNKDTKIIYQKKASRMSSCKGPLHIEVTPEVCCMFSPQFHEYKFRSGITNYDLSHWKYVLVIAVLACKQEQEPYS